MSLFRQLGLLSQCKIVPVIPIPIILKNGFDQQQFLLKTEYFLLLRVMLICSGLHSSFSDFV